MSSIDIDSVWVKVKAHFPAYAGGALLVASLGYFCYNFSGGLIGIIGVLSGHTVTYEGPDGRKVTSTPPHAEPKSAPTSTAQNEPKVDEPLPPTNRPTVEPNNTPPALVQNTPELEAPTSDGEKVPAINLKSAIKPLPQVGTSKRTPAQTSQKAKQIAFAPPINLLPTKRANGNITVEVPFPLGDNEAETPTKNSYSRNDMFWIHQTYKCEHYGDEPMYEACYIAPKGPKNKRPLVRAW